MVRLLSFLCVCLLACLLTFRVALSYTTATFAAPMSRGNAPRGMSLLFDTQRSKVEGQPFLPVMDQQQQTVTQQLQQQQQQQQQQQETPPAPTVTQLPLETHITTSKPESLRTERLSVTATPPINNVQQNVRRKRYIKDKYHTAYIPYLKGIYNMRITCDRATNEVYRHNFTYPPNFSCKSQIPKLTESERKIKTRQQLRIWCEGEKSLGAVETVSWDTPLQTFSDNSSRACLSLYIRQNCYDDYPIPNIVHWLYFADGTLDLRKAVPFYSVFSILKPCLVLLHGNHFLPGPYWDALIPHAPNLVHVPRSPQTHIHGRKIVHVANQADIARLEVLQEFGGLYLDNDEIILRPVDIFRATGFAAFHEGVTKTVSNAVLFARPDHEITKIWLKNYDSYDGVSWASHSILYVTELPRHHPDLIQEFAPLFIKYDWQRLHNLYRKSCSLGDSFGAHLYASSYPEKADFEYLKTTDSTFGRLARYVLFGDARICT
ncbi:uncharacterized protein LOC106012621 [Aplysia californica]|uniref:Uncharacterized protein LOC106012621 n=1 Tax=Aplysia californica TaxID=6500 RepID=A0ABM1A639_APLCA|nr:uncharacterized protein LOC106012621 [Aplysia californica]